MWHCPRIGQQRQFAPQVQRPRRRSRISDLTIRNTTPIRIRLLEHYGVDTKTATEDACRIEHYISDTSVRAIKEYMKKAVD